MISVCIPTYRRSTNLMSLLARLLAEDIIGEVLIAITGDEYHSIKEPIIFEQLIRALEMKGIDVRWVSGLGGLMEAKLWFKSEVSYDIMCILDDDAIPDAGYFELADWFQDTKVGAVSGSLQTPINYYNYTAWSDDKISVEGNRSNTLRFTEDGLIDESDKYQVYRIHGGGAFECDYLIGTALFIRPELLEIDEHFEIENSAGEEVDFTYRLTQMGYKLIYDADKVCWHIDPRVGGMRGKEDVSVEMFKYIREKWDI